MKIMKIRMILAYLIMGLWGLVLYPLGFYPFRIRDREGKAFERFDKKVVALFYRISNTLSPAQYKAMTLRDKR